MGEFTKLNMPVPPRAASLVYTALFNASITATLIAVHGVGDARFATCNIFVIHHVVYTRFHEIVVRVRSTRTHFTLSWGVCKTMQPLDLVPMT